MLSEMGEQGNRRCSGRCSSAGYGTDIRQGRYGAFPAGRERRRATVLIGKVGGHPADSYFIQRGRRILSGKSVISDYFPVGAESGGLPPRESSDV